ncbi:MULTISPECIES: DUF1707 domain-containing protein [unclassified Streptomyces]|uniref:DUF1707 SHOCT-like domain-containing protein n=1 Tax=unclassified Streptomyces TaxID=2593676 RepID=UPI002DDB0DAE|nr:MULTISPECIES: DUF1707 domain-containing protein [unclassified Streptomyces]WSA95369.1 DUF1707 domain-containing protein [Streptomyces sp. NBC_01795]WSS12006.1 DUF1707 domain-containing protein [Streptomyces sp. NBC_01186]WSS40720.1 DUF1707 domain-containing protein [Streptomyces sp. NBC_01187]
MSAQPPQNGYGRDGEEGRTRASDAEREAAVERLSEATAEGRLTLEELADRCEAAYLARYRDELERVAADLPPPVSPVSPGSAGKGSGSGVYRAGVGDVTQEAPAPGPSGGIEAQALLGDLTLDLTRTRMPSSGPLRVMAKALAGDVVLIVPESVEVRVECRRLAGDVRDRRQPRPVPEGAPRLLVTGTAALGDIVVKHPHGNRRSPWREWIDAALKTV